jgi:methionyl-tRNA synthetase
MKILITSALPYANGPIHFGHIAGAYLPADCFARFCRLRGDDVLYICGSDEYGVAITLTAEMAGRTPQEHVDLFHAVNQELFAKLGFQFDHYSRTTSSCHAPIVQQFFKDLLANGYIEEKVTEQLYSKADQKFLADRYVVGTCPRCGHTEARGDECQKCGASYEATDLKNPRSKLSGASLVKKPTKHWFLRFDLFKDQLKAWLLSKTWKPNVAQFALAYIDDLKPRAITRDGTWGVPIPLPNTEGKVLYVWFDAPIGYISATEEWDSKRWKDFWLDPATRYVQFIGKDNIPFHAVFFPAMIMGQNTPYKLVDDLPANEFFNLEGKQFSKSDGWMIDLKTFFEHFTADQIRYAIAANAPETQDSEFSWKDFQLRCNSELLGKYGNLANRVLVFIARHAEGKIPAASCDEEFCSKLALLAVEAAQAYDSYHLRKASQLIMEIAQVGNAYFDAKKPWQLAKTPENHPEMLKVLASCLECLKTLALVSSPIIPSTAAKLWLLLGQKAPLDRWEHVLKTPLKPHTPLPQPEILFQRVEDPVIADELQNLLSLKNLTKS